MILTITGPSGSGKTSLLHFLTKKYGIKPLLTTTTRSPRKGERSGVDYYFVTPEEFSEMKFFERTTFDHNHYGMEKEELKKALHDPDKVYAIIVDRKGAKKYRNLAHRGVFSVYLDVKKDFAEEMLEKRDGKKAAKKRIRQDKAKGMYEAKGYDCVLHNGKDTTMGEIAYDFMNYVESRNWAKHIFGKWVA